MNSRLIAASLFAATCFTLSSVVMAEVIKLPVGEQTQTWDGQLPSRGATKSQVEAEFGPPNSTDGPSGAPPIYFWEYQDFTVYFESDYVIHTVVKKLK